MNIDNNNFLAQIAEKTHIYEGKEGIRSILRTIYTHAPIGTKGVSKYTQIPVPVISAVRRELEQAGILIRKNGMLLSDSGMQYVRDVLKFGKDLQLTKHDILAPNFVVPETMHSLVDQMRKYVQEAPKFDATLDQAPCTAETALRRALLMYVQGAIEGKHIALIGDDDLVSIALCLVARYVGGVQIIPRLTVLELDTRFIAYIESIAAKQNFPIKCIRHDMRQSLPEDLLHKFDVVETDPPYSAAGALLFLSRGVELLRQESEKLLFLSFAHWPTDKKIELEKIFSKLGLSVENQHRGFNLYRGASILGSTSTLFELRTSSQIHSLFAHKTFTGSIYTASQAKTKNYIK